MVPSPRSWSAGWRRCSAMCGRFLINSAPEELRQWFAAEFSHTGLNLGPRFNVAPTQGVAIVRGRSEGHGRELRIIRRADGSTQREAVMACWGLIPSWAKDASIGNKMINARAEGVTDKPSFRAAFRARRCIIPASGFYARMARPVGKR